jgi:hypothetical protein
MGVGVDGGRDGAATGLKVGGGCGFATAVSGALASGFAVGDETAGSGVVAGSGVAGGGVAG